jgi:hypothetical protein
VHKSGINHGEGNHMNYPLTIESFERARNSSENEAMRNLAEGMIALSHAIQSDFGTLERELSAIKQELSRLKNRI